MKSPKIRFKEFQNEWNSRILGDICSFSKGKGYSKSDLTPNGNPIILYGSLYTNYKAVIEKIDTFAKLKENSILSFGDEVIIPSSGETAEDISIASAVKFKNAIIGGDLNILKPKINSIFLVYNLSNGNTKKEISKKAQGKSVVHLYNNDLKEIKTRIPNDIKEQEKIGEFFRKIDVILDLENSRFKKLENFKKTMLDKLFVKNGADEPQIRLGSFKDKWNSKILGDICEIKRGERITKQELLLNGEFPVISGGVSPMGFLDKFNRQANTITIAQYGTAGYVNFQKNKFWANDICYSLFSKAKTNNLFLYYSLKNLQNYIYTLVNRAVPEHLPQERLSKLEFRIPNDIKEQEKIGEFFRKIDEILEFSQKKITKLENIKKYLLNKMFV